MRPRFLNWTKITRCIGKKLRTKTYRYRSFKTPYFRKTKRYKIRMKRLLTLRRSWEHWSSKETNSLKSPSSKRYWIVLETTAKISIFRLRSLISQWMIRHLRPDFRKWLTMARQELICSWRMRTVCWRMPWPKSREISKVPSINR